MFYVGQKVVCIDNKPQQGDGWWSEEVPVPQEGEIYTISIPNYLDNTQSEVCHILELLNPYGYLVIRFRPLVEKKTDISIFKALLTPINTKELEEV